MTFSSPGPYFGYNPEVFTEVFEEGGGTILGDYNYVPLDDTDFSTQVNEIANLDEPPAVVYSAMIASQGVQLAAQLEAAGVDTTMLMADAFDATGIRDGRDRRLLRHDPRVLRAGPGGGAGRASPRPPAHRSRNRSFGTLAADAILVLIAAYQAAGTTDGAERGAPSPMSTSTASPGG